MKLSVRERLLLLGVLPKEGGTLDTIRIRHNLRQTLSFSEDEHKTYEFKQDGDQLHWKNDEIEADIEIGPKAHAVVCAGLKEFLDKGKLSEDHLSLWDKFNTDE